MKRLTIKGCGTALLTPFSGSNVDYDAYAATVDRQVKAGVDFLVPLGTTAETPCLSMDERICLLKTTIDHAGGLPVIVGAGTNSLEDTIRLIRQYEPYGPDGFLVVVPYYNKPTQEGQYQYFKAVAESTDKAIVIYNVPGRAGVNMQAETTLRLARDVENIIAIKEASSNYAQICSIIREAPEGFSVMSGNDDETIALMAAGAAGVISVASNVAPQEITELTNAMMNNNLVKARMMHQRLFPLFRNLFVESNPIPAKAAMARLGLMNNELRLPLTKASEHTEEIIAKTLDDLWQK